MNPNELTRSLTEAEPEKSDDAFNKENNKSEHELTYTEILGAYSRNIKETLEQKRTYKKAIFWLSFVLLCLFTLAIIALIVFSFLSQSTLVERISLIVPGLVSFLTVFIVIPHVITQYLFNADEEKYMSDIIKHIQDYDKKMDS